MTVDRFLKEARAVQSVRSELRRLANSRLLDPLTPDEQARYDLLCRQEREFLAGTPTR